MLTFTVMGLGGLGLGLREGLREGLRRRLPRNGEGDRGLGEGLRERVLRRRRGGNGAARGLGFSRTPMMFNMSSSSVMKARSCWSK